MALAKAFAITSLPFVLAETATGFISLTAVDLRIPPEFGVGTILDSGILITGLALMAIRATRRTPVGEMRLTKEEQSAAKEEKT